MLIALKAQEERRLMREETTFEGALASKQPNVGKFKKDFGVIRVGSTSATTREKNEIRRNCILPVNTEGRKVIHPLDVGDDIMLSVLSVTK